MVRLKVRIALRRIGFWIKYPSSIPGYFVWHWRRLTGWTPPGKMIIYDPKQQ